MDEKRVAAFNALPQASACRLIDFEDIQVIPGTILRTYFLIVKGTKPWVTMDVGLHPLPYATRPEFTGIEVVGCQNGIGLPQAGPLQRGDRVHASDRHQGHRGDRRERAEEDRDIVRGMAIDGASRSAVVPAKRSASRDP